MHSAQNNNFFCQTMTYFFPIGVIKDYKAWLFEKFIFGPEAYFSFKITSILVRQVVSPKKNGDVIGKIHCLILWCSICTPLILVLASMNMAGTSAIIEWEWTTLANSSYKCERIRLETIYFSFRLDIGVRNFNHMNEFFPITKLKKDRINLWRTNLWQNKLTKDMEYQSAL